MFNVLLAIGAGYAALVGLLYVAQDRLLYHPTSEMLATPDAYGMTYEDVQLETEDGETIHGWWIPADAPRGTLLFCHGNAGNISGRLDSIEQFRRLGLNVFIFDYRGFGQSSGSPSEEGLYRDGEAAWQHLTETRGIEPDRLVVFGRSLGSGVASWLAAKHTPRATILESPFTTVPDVAARHYPFIPARHLTRATFDNLSRVKQLAMPLLVIHSETDRVIPYEHGRALYEAAAAPKQFVDLEGGHADGFLVTGPRYLESIDAFLTEAGLPPSQASENP